MSQYSEQDSERVRQAERSSAGAETQQLTLPAGYTTSGAPASTSRTSLLGLLLLGIGALLLLVRVPFGGIDIQGGMVLLTIGSVFYFFGLWRRIYGLIIPASILTGLSVGVAFADITDGVSVLWGLALGFLAVYVLGSRLFRQSNPWPVIPAVILFAVGVLVAVANLPSFLAAGLIWVPLLLIGAGLYLGWLRRP